MKLNLGCGYNLLDGYTNVDKFPTSPQTLLCDLELRWPFETASVDEAVFNHSLEHMGQTTSAFLNLIKELYRVLKLGAQVTITVPHHRSDDFAGDPTHVRIVTLEALSLFSKTNNQFWIDNGYANTPLGIYLDVDFQIVGLVAKLTPHWRKLRDEGLSDQELDYAVRTFNNVVSEVTFVLEKK